jgi:hypothetical protein
MSNPAMLMGLAGAMGGKGGGSTKVNQNTSTASNSTVALTNFASVGGNYGPISPSTTSTSTPTANNAGGADTTDGMYTPVSTDPISANAPVGNVGSAFGGVDSSALLWIGLAVAAVAAYMMFGRK